MLVLSCVVGLGKIVAMQPLHLNVILKWHEDIKIPYFQEHVSNHGNWEGLQTKNQRDPY